MKDGPDNVEREHNAVSSPPIPPQPGQAAAEPDLQRAVELAKQYATHTNFVSNTTFGDAVLLARALLRVRSGGWREIGTLPEWDARPGTMFIKLTGHKTHSGAMWTRTGWGIARITKQHPLGFYADDIAHICQSNDMDYDGCAVSHWAPIQEPVPPAPLTTRTHATEE